MIINRKLVTLIVCFLLLIGFSLSAHAIENQPRLAILSDSVFSQAGDLLSVELSQQTNVVLLERSEMRKILQEQKLVLSGISIKESIKVGQILGADGLLILNTTRTGTNTYLVTTLIAVKQGVILDAMESPWPMKDESQWVKLVRTHFQPLLPKLGVLAKDALPISVLNLRSAANSPESKQLEHELTELLLNRLTHEKELFILERRKLDKLTTEKEFAKTEDSPFWNGSYLLEGIVDKNGFSKEAATISARLVPPGGGAPMEIEISGKRNEPGQLIEQLARRIMGSLKKQSSAPEWKPAAEALQYYEEAKWALKWQLNKEAQAAAESAWALGKRDMDSALVRIKAYLTDVSPDPHYQEGTMYDFKADDQKITFMLEAEKQEDNAAELIWEHFGDGDNIIRYLTIFNPPREEQIDAAIHGLNLYQDLSLTKFLEEPKINTDWYRLGVDSLVGAARVLQHYYLVRGSWKGVEPKLAELRKLAREVSEYILSAPSVRDTYWVGNRIATYDELYRLSEGTNIFQCKLLWGPFWQETPEDCIALYRSLMDSDVFCYIHKDFWFRPIENPLITAWKPEDSQRIQPVWNQYMQGLRDSTNLFQRLEYRSVQLSRAGRPEEMETRFNSLISLLFENREAIVTNNVDLLYLEWRIGDLVGHMGGDVTNPTKEKLQRQFYAEYRPKIEAMHEEYRKKMNERKQQEEKQALFDKQKEILRGTTYDSATFHRTFYFFEYSPAQAAELEPLLANYKSNLLAQAGGQTEAKKGAFKLKIASVEWVERRLRDVLHPPAAKVVVTKPQTHTNIVISSPRKWETPDMSPEALLVDKFFAIPEKLFPDESHSNIRVFAHRIREGNLLLDLRYEVRSEYLAGVPYRAAIAIWNPPDGGWQIIPYPLSEDRNAAPVGFMGETERGLYFEFFKRDLYVSDWKGMARYNMESARWEKLGTLEPKLSQLFAIDDHLYAANDESIFEILDRGQGTRILASTRRRPAVTTLDLLPKLNSPALFPGPDKTIRTCIDGKIYIWNGKDWQESLNLRVNKRPEIFEEGTLLRSIPYRGEARVWFLPCAKTNMDLYYEEQIIDPYMGGSVIGAGRTFGPSDGNTARVKPVWRSGSTLQTANAPALATQTNLLFFHEDCIVTNNSGQWSVLENNGHHAFLVCMESGLQKPLMVPLKFDSRRGPLPSANLSAKLGRWDFGFPWMVHAADCVVIGYSGMAGIWCLPNAQLQAAIHHERELRLGQNAEGITKLDRMRKELVAQYDRNHDGSLSPAEQEEAVNDLRWLELNWPLMDTNENGFLDGEDNLAIFDANRNGQAESVELSAMEKIQVLIAAKLIEHFDTNHNGALDEPELRQTAAALNNANHGKETHFSIGLWRSHDANQDGKLDQKELSEMLSYLTKRSIMASHRQANVGPVTPPSLFDWKNPKTQQMYKAAVEQLWQEHHQLDVVK